MDMNVILRAAMLMTLDGLSDEELSALYLKAAQNLDPTSLSFYERVQTLFKHNNKLGYPIADDLALSAMKTAVDSRLPAVDQDKVDAFKKSLDDKGVNIR